jgi:uncharacterized protein YbaR (Trm112 family)
MNLALTDQLTCPRCGPGFGLVLLADRVVGRRVYEGKLGCARCRAEYAVREGVAELMVEAARAPTRDVAIDADRLSALLGVTEGPALLLLLGAFEGVAEQMAASLPDVEMIVAHPAIEPGDERAGVSRLRIGHVVPLHDRVVRGVAIADAMELALVREAARVCGLATRVIITNTSADVRSALPQLGLHVLAEQGETLVAVRHS